MRQRLWIAALVGMCLAGCGKEGGDGSSAPIDDYTVTEGSTEGTLTSSSTEISGTGTVQFSTPIGGVSTGRNFDITITLQDNGYVRLIAYAATGLTGGQEVVFSRSGKVLGVNLSSGSGDSDRSSAFTGDDASAAKNWLVDAHNNESPTHILIWPAGSDTTRVDTEKASESPAAGNGIGEYWGLKLYKASVTRARARAAKSND